MDKHKNIQESVVQYKPENKMSREENCGFCLLTHHQASASLGENNCYKVDTGYSIHLDP